MQDFVGTKVLILRRNYHFSGETIVLWLNLILGEEILGRVEKNSRLRLEFLIPRENPDLVVICNRGRSHSRLGGPIGVFSKMAVRGAVKSLLELGKGQRHKAERRVW